MPPKNYLSKIKNNNISWDSFVITDHKIIKYCLGEKNDILSSINDHQVEV